MDPVIIVGAGPVGLALALALARQEVPSVVLDEGPGKDEQRLARTVVLHEDTAALLERLSGVPLAEAGFRWAGWRSMRRRQVMRQVRFQEGEETDPQVGAGGPRDGSEDIVERTAGLPPLHIPQHVLTTALRDAIAGERLVKIAVESRVDAIEQETSGVTA
ncbi:FAD-dependent monooxygenase, partial [Streptomyces ipomoeae]